MGPENLIPTGIRFLDRPAHSESLYLLHYPAPHFATWCSVYRITYVYFSLVANIDAAAIPDHSQVQKVAAILGVSKDLLVDALTRKTIFVQGEKVVSCLKLKYHGL